MSTPQSSIYICSGVNLDNRYEHSIYFENAAAQMEYFAAKTVRVLAAYSYLRKSWPLKVEATMEEAKKWTYLLFQNGSGGKYYFYFINNIEYINDNTVELQLELDVIQTYMFDYELLPCFVERQHTPTDKPGEHTVEEGLDIGEMWDNQYTNLNEYMGNYAIMIMSTINPAAQTAEQAIPALANLYNDVFSGLKIWAVNSVYWAKLGAQLDKLDAIGKADGIIAMWVYPMNLFRIASTASWADADDFILPVEGAVAIDDPEPLTATINPIKSDLNGYTPKNNKLHTYPYHFLYVTNNQGGSAVYRIERFEDRDNISFFLSGALSPDAGVRLTPVYYNMDDAEVQNPEFNYKEGLSLGSFPTCSWDSDIYKMWLAQNQNTNSLAMTTGNMKVAGGIISGIGSLFMGNVAGAVAGGGVAVSGAIGIAEQLALKADKSIEPPQAKGSFSTSVNVTDYQHSFVVYERCVSAENARIIDDYFTMYGYKINRVQAPDRNARKAFTYVKTIGCHIKGNLCNEDTVKIESVYDSGITFWRDGDRMCDYTQDNSPETEG